MILLWYFIVINFNSDFFLKANNSVSPIQGGEDPDFLTVSGQLETNLSEDKELGSLCR